MSDRSPAKRPALPDEAISGRADSAARNEGEQIFAN